MANLGELVVRLRADMSQFDGSMSSVGGMLSKVGNSMTSMGKTMTMGLTTPIVGLGVTALKMSANFETGMNRVSALTGATTKQFDAMREKSLELGSTTQYSASEVADAMGFLGMAGIKANDILTVIPDTLNLASAAQMDLARTADVASNMLTAFGLEANEMGRVSDVMTKAFTSTNVDLEMLAESMKYAAPVAKGFGISMEETAAMVGLFGNAGIQGSNAGTGLRAALTRLVKPGKDGAQAMKQMNLETIDAKGNMRPIVDILGDLEKGFVGMGNAEKGAIMAKIFGMQHGSKWTALMDQGNFKLKEQIELLKNSGGAAKQVADVQMSGLNGAIKALTSAFERLMIAIGDSGFLDDITGMTEGLVEFVQGLAKSNPEMLKMGVIVGLVVAAIGPLLIIVGSLASAIGTIVTVIGTIGAPIAAAIVGIVALIGVIIAINLNFDKVKKMFLEAPTWVKVLVGAFALLTPVGSIIASVTAAIQGIRWAMTPAIEQTKLFGDETSAATEKALGSYMKLSNDAQMQLMQLDLGAQVITQGMANKMITTYSDMHTKIIEGMKQKQAAELETLQGTFAATKELTDKERQAIIDKTKEFNEQEVEGVKVQQQIIDTIMKEAAKEKRRLTEEEIETIGRIRESMNTKAIESLTKNELEQKSIYERMKIGATEQTSAMAAEIVKHSVDAKNKTVKEAEDMYNKRVKTIIKMRDEVGSISEEEAERLILAAEDVKNKTVKKAEDMHKKILTGAKEKAKDHVKEVDWETGEIKSNWQIFCDDVVKYNDDMNKKVDKIYKDIWKSITDIWKSIKDFFVKEWNEIKTTAQNDWNNIKTIITNVWISIKTTTMFILNAIKLAIMTYWNSIKTSTSSVWNSIKTVISIAIKSVQTTVTNVASTIESKLSGMAESAYTWGSNLVSSFVDGLKSKIKDVGTAALNIATSVADFIQHKSPARKGPGSSSDKWMPNLMKMLIQGINDAIPEFRSTTENLAQAIYDGFRQVGEVEKMFDDIRNKINDTWSKTIQETKSNLNDLGNAIYTALKAQYDDELLYEEQKATARLDKIVKAKEKEIEEIKNSAEKAIEAEKKAGEKRLKYLESTSNEAIKLFEKEANEKLRLLDEDTYNRVNSLQKQIDAIEEQKKEEERLEKERVQKAKLSELIRATATYNSLEEKEKAEKDYKDYLAKIEKEKVEEARKAQIEDLKNRIATVKEEASKEAAIIKETLTAEKATEQAFKKEQLDTTKTYNEKELDEIKATADNKINIKQYEIDDEKKRTNEYLEFYRKYTARLKEEDKLYTEAKLLLMKKNQDKLVELLKTYYPNWQNAGQSFADKFMDGFRSIHSSMATEINRVMSSVQTGMNVNVGAINNSINAIEDTWQTTVDNMMRNSLKWSTASASQKVNLANQNKQLGSSLGMTSKDGAWYLPSGQKAYDTSTLTGQQKQSLMSGGSSNINVSVNIDGKKVASAVAPHMVNQAKMQGVR
jgi:TP901 family phage tail tape measure protein